MKSKDGISILTLTIILIAGMLIYWLALTPDSFGFYHDDSIYVTNAKAMAEGHGYRIISLPGEPAQTKYPPLYSFLLSLIWRVNPNFPTNLIPMMSLSIPITLLFLIGTWFYLIRKNYASQLQSLIIVGLVALNWRTIILASGIYTEMLYSLLAVIGLYLAEGYESESPGWLKEIALGLIIGLAFLTRTSGIVLFVSFVIYFLIRKKLSKIVLPLIISLVIILSWLGWSYLNRPTEYGANMAYYTNYLKDFSDIIANIQAKTHEPQVVILLKFIAKNSLLLLPVSIPLVCLGLKYDSLQGLNFYLLCLGLLTMLATFLLIIRGFLNSCGQRWRLLHTYFVLYLLFHLLWPYAVYDRFLMPVLPFLLLFLISEMESFIKLAFKKQVTKNRLETITNIGLITVTIAWIAGIGLYNLGAGLYRALTTYKTFCSERFAADLEAIRWLEKNTDIQDILICYRDPMYYLYSGHKATRSSSFIQDSKTQSDSDNFEDQAEAFYRIISENKAKYFILTSSDLDLESQAASRREKLKEFIQNFNRSLFPVYDSGDNRVVIYKINVLEEREIKER